jgi:uncharacterized protein
MSRVSWVVVGLLSGAAAHAASFDCAKAATSTEKSICASPTLSEYDEHLARYYGAARAHVGPSAAPCLARNQREWLAVRNACNDAACLERTYRRRLAELDPLQPGMTAVKHLELPATRALVWVQGPAEDTGAAPRGAKPDPLRVTGKIVDDVTDGDGFVIRDAKGVKHALLTSMFITKSSGVAYETLALEPDVTYEAVGQRERSSDGVDHFAPGYCTFVWRLPKP